MSEIHLLLQTTQHTTKIGTVETDSSAECIVKDQFGRTMGTVSSDGRLLLDGGAQLGFVDLASGEVFRGSHPQPDELMGTIQSTGRIHDEKDRPIAALASDESTLSDPERRNREASGGLLLLHAIQGEAFGR